MEDRTLEVPFRAAAKIGIAAGLEQSRTANSYPLIDLIWREGKASCGDQRTSRAFVHRSFHYPTIVNFSIALCRTLATSADLCRSLLSSRRRGPPVKPSVVAEAPHTRARCALENQRDGEWQPNGNNR